ncbi:RNA polymerase sigma factor [Acidobacteriota bacterium]
MELNFLCVFKKLKRIFRTDLKPLNGTHNAINIEEYYIRYGPMVLRRCRKMLNNEQTAHDAMHEVFLNVILNQKRLKGTHPSALLYRIATNICLNKIRSQRYTDKRRYIELLNNIQFFESSEEESTARLLFEFVLEKEKSTTRNIAVMYFLNGMTIKEIATTMKLSISGVHKHLEKLRRKIREKGEIS